RRSLNDERGVRAWLRARRFRLGASKPAWYSTLYYNHSGLNVWKNSNCKGPCNFRSSAYTQRWRSGQNHIHRRALYDGSAASVEERARRACAGFADCARNGKWRSAPGGSRGPEYAWYTLDRRAGDTPDYRRD